MVSRARVKRPLEWIKEFAKRSLVSLPRHFPVQRGGTGPVLGFDASTTGGGAWLAFSNNERPSHFLVADWTSSDEVLLRAKRGDPASQAVWETYALLLAVDAWSEKLAVRTGTLELRGDAQGILAAVLRRRARSPIINIMIAEIQLCLGKSMFDVYGSHVWSEDNELADNLSRLGEGAKMPKEFDRVPATKVVKHPWRFLTPGGVHAAVMARADE